MTSDIHTDDDALAGPSRTTCWRSNALTGTDVQRVRRDGREYLEFPVIALRGMVYDYPENGTKELLPAEHIRETADVWEGAAIVFQHPENREKTAATPDAYTGEVIGQAHSPEIVDGDKLRVNALVDVEKATDISGPAADVVDRLEAGEELSVSAGYRTESTPAADRRGRSAPAVTTRGQTPTLTSGRRPGSAAVTTSSGGTDDPPQRRRPRAPSSASGQRRLLGGHTSPGARLDTGRRPRGGRDPTEAATQNDALRVGAARRPPWRRRSPQLPVARRPPARRRGETVTVAKPQLRPPVPADPARVSGVYGRIHTLPPGVARV